MEISNVQQKKSGTQMRPALDTAVYRFYLNDKEYYLIERFSRAIGWLYWRLPPTVGIPAG